MEDQAPTGGSTPQADDSNNMNNSAPPSAPNPPTSTPPTPPTGQANEPAAPVLLAAGSEHKGLAIVGYIIPILFFLPLVTEGKNDPFAKFHANQQLNLLIWYVMANFIMIIPVLGWIAGPLMWLFGIVLAIMGIMNASQGTQKELPLIGKYSLLK